MPTTKMVKYTEKIDATMKIRFRIIENINAHRPLWIVPVGVGIIEVDSTKLPKRKLTSEQLERAVKTLYPSARRI